MISNIESSSDYVTVKRKGWNARPPKHKYDKIGIVRRIVLHHAYKPTGRQYKGEATIQAIQDYHMDIRGWNDIGYHFLLSPDGSLLFEGRPLSAPGAHCGHGEGEKNISFGNAGSIGICVIGNYDQEFPSVGLLKSLGSLIKNICDSTGLDSNSNVYGHLEAWLPRRQQKTCPGRNLFLSTIGPERWVRQTGDKEAWKVCEMWGDRSFRK